MVIILCIRLRNLTPSECQPVMEGPWHQLCLNDTPPLPPPRGRLQQAPSLCQVQSLEGEVGGGSRGVGEFLPPGHPHPGPASLHQPPLCLRPHSLWRDFTVLMAWAVKPALSQLKAFFVRRWKKTEKEENERARRERILEYLPLPGHSPSIHGKGETPPLTPWGPV